MTKKHFEAAAKQIRQMYQLAAEQDRDLGPGTGHDMRHRAAGAEDVFVSVATDADPRFDSVRFRQACRPWTVPLAAVELREVAGPSPRFFKVISSGVMRGDIIAFFPRRVRGDMFYIRSLGGISEWCGNRWWKLDEMTPDWVTEMTEAEVFNYCPAAVIPPKI